MFAVSRSRRAELALAGLPGLVHFGLEPLRLYPMRSATRIRLYLQGEGILNLESLTISGPQDIVPAIASVRMSSRDPSSRAAEDLLSGGPIHTDAESCPWWEVAFKTPVRIEEMVIGNRAGIWSGRAYGLCIDITDESDNTWTYDHLDLGRIGHQLRDYQSRAEAFVSHCYKLAAASGSAGSGLLTEFVQSTAKLVSAITQAYAGQSVPDELLVEHRVAILSCLTRIHEPLTGKDLISTLKHAYPLLDWLLPRAKSSRVETDYPVELAALSLMFVTVLTDQRNVRIAHIKDNQRLLTDPLCIGFVEREVNRLYRATGLTRTALPIMFRAHGMTGSALIAQPESFVRSMKEIEAIFDGIGYEAAICYGTFLGAVREKGFIPHDDDVDMAFLTKREGDANLGEELNEIIALLARQGVEAGKAAGHSFLKIRAPEHKRLVDVFPIIPRGDDVVGMFMQELKLRDVPRSVVLPFAKVELYGETFRAPRSADGFLTERYGPTWRIPQRVVGSKTVTV